VDDLKISSKALKPLLKPVGAWFLARVFARVFGEQVKQLYPKVQCRLLTDRE